ncbi:MAG: alanine--tRNA ligase [Bacteroidia bacterium]|nr:alanine--tRNA ligase [Bacteroidia bacterium]MDG2042759.1 alanine--tRNA ligase [Bacteroidia bacterium]|tara:strand:+ start:1740 stop:4364 length:2625 start_codon:yes stop_codon:yes gene_type:complete
MTAQDIRKTFLAFFEKKGHKIVESAPIVIKDDPTLMFTNAGMNQFKDIFLGNQSPIHSRIVDTQKCLRVSGKHNDLEEVGVDTYHHTMFEMLGNWSFGDYFKEDAINWAWELLTDVYNLDKDRLYVSIFEGSKSDDLDLDSDAKSIWLNHVSEDRIILGDKKDNFWEMGETGPCGPCSEIHIDLRSDEERSKVDGAGLVNADHEQVIELWNLVFMEYNRKADGSLLALPAKHVDTGMGLERLVRAVHSQQSNYDSDLFMDTIKALEDVSGYTYGEEDSTDIAFRVIADHLRAVCFVVSDGQLPDNSGAGYVIRRILRRAVRYGYSFLDLDSPFLYQLVDGFVGKFENVFANLSTQKDFIIKVVEQEEKSFLNTLNNGLKLFENYARSETKMISGIHAFELYDTFGFPIDLTQLLAKEQNIKVDVKGFEKELAEQKNRSRTDARKTTGDWVELLEDDREEFIGYDYTESEVSITRYREVTVKDKKQFHLIFNYTPFYAESGGQVGDKGLIAGQSDNHQIEIFDTQKENQLIVHLVKELPKDMNQKFMAKVNSDHRAAVTLNHSATHLLQAALRQILGDHVTQKGSLVNKKYLRFDFSHFQKVDKDELEEIEKLVNQKIRSSIPLKEDRNIPFDKAIEQGAMALFGEKYGDTVRMVTFDKKYSIELCGGTHVKNTAQIGSFRIVQEGAVAAGVRRIEAITGNQADIYVKGQLDLLSEIRSELGNQQNIIKAIQDIKNENTLFQDKLQVFENRQLVILKDHLKSSVKDIDDMKVIIELIKVDKASQVKDLCFQLKGEIENLFCVLIADVLGKPNISVMISDQLVNQKNYHAGNLVKEWSKEIKGGGGGQPFFAQAGGADVSGLKRVEESAINFINEG